MRVLISRPVRKNIPIITFDRRGINTTASVWVGGIVVFRSQPALLPDAQLEAQTYIRYRAACKHNAMIERDDSDHAWQCADCGYIYGQ